jgi:hypothetical protein
MALVALATLPACLGLDKLSDAINPVSADTATLTRKFAQQLEPQPSMQRVSGMAMGLRLQTLFPSGMFGTYGSYPPSTFDPLNTTGLTAALSSEQRPFTAIAQMAMRDEAALACSYTQYYATSYLNPAGAIFSTKNILLPGETLPTDPALALALAVARNVWLDLYLPTDPEVLELASLYNQVLALEAPAPSASPSPAPKGGSTAPAPSAAAVAMGKRAVCEAALGAPQFWFGSATDTDVYRRAALEVGYHIPTMQELADFKAGQFTAKSYVAKIQTDTTPVSSTVASPQANYLTAVNAWHEDWLGLRSLGFFCGNQSGDQYVRNYSYQRPGANYSGSILANFQAIKGTPLAGIPTSSGYEGPPGLVSYIPGATFTGTEAGVELGDTALKIPKYQAFDPRTVMLLWQHQIPSGSGKWVTLAAWVKAGYESMFEENTEYKDMSLCSQPSPAPSPMAANAGYPNYGPIPGWYQCNGKLPDGTITHLWDITTPTCNVTGGCPAGYQYLSTDGTDGSLGTILGENSLVSNFKAGDRALRRFAPSGEQSGYSVVEGWYAREPMLVSNVLDRYLFACNLRYPNGFLEYRYGARAAVTPAPPNGPTSPHYYYWNANEVNTAWPIIGNNAMTDSIAHPLILNEFMRCGTPASEDQFASVTFPSAAAEDLLYPRGWTTDTEFNNPSFVPAVNTLATNLAVGIGYFGWSTSATPEGLGHTNLINDLYAEPYNLVDEIITQHHPYTDLVAGNYTVGREELELFYRSSDLYLPIYPKDFAYASGGQPGPSPLSATTSGGLAKPPAASALRVIPGDRNPGGVMAHPLTMIEDPTGSPPTMLNNLSALYAGGNTIAPMKMSGILTMPGFRFPVAPELRTLASRYYIRLLCGDPTIVPPNPTNMNVVEEQAALNPVLKAHVQPTCIVCHVNLDPLAQALGENFGANVQVNDVAAFTGEMSTMNGAPWYQWGPVRQPGKTTPAGAFLGYQVQGVEQVGQLLAGTFPGEDIASKTLFPSCVVQTMLKYTFGRAPALADQPLIQSLTTEFMSNPDFDTLIQNLVDSQSYNQRD